MTMALSKAAEDGATDGRLRVDRQHVGVGGGLRRARRHPLRGGRAGGQHRARQARPGAGARRHASASSRARSTTRCGSSASCADRHPITLVNNLNPYRLEGQKTAALEIVDELGGAPDWLALPVGNGGNITAYWRGFHEAVAARRRRPTCRACWAAQAAGSAAMVEGRDVAQPGHGGDRHPHRRARCAARRPRAAARESERRLRGRAGRGDPGLVRPRSRARRASSASRRARPASPGWPAAGPPGTVRGGRARGLRAHRPRPQGSRHRDRAQP